MRWRFSKLDWGYAVGELIIVTAGVLIALAIDQWNNDRLDRVEEVLFVDRFISDIRDDLAGISMGLRLSPAKEEHLLRLYSALSSGERPTDAAGFLEDVVVGARYGWTQASVRRYTFDEVLGGLEEYRQMSWQRQGHLFGVPFYYIEYGIAQLGALQLWLQFKRDRSKAIDNYKQALSLGGSRPLPELFEAAELDFNFGPETMARLMAEVQGELNSLPA